MTRHDSLMLLHGGAIRAVFMCLLMIMVPTTPLLSNDHQPLPSQSSTRVFAPNVNQTAVNITDSGMLSIPYNRSFTEGGIDVAPRWSASPDASAQFGMETNSGWNGQHNGTQGIGHGGQLSLATSSSLTTVTDFESLVQTPIGWRGTGPDHPVWNIAQPNGSAAANGTPPQATDGQHVLATQGRGGLGASMNGCLISPVWDVPDFIGQFNLSFDQWISLQDDDAAWVEIRVLGGQWTSILPDTGYTNVTGTSGAPVQTWAGATDAWRSVQFSLDDQLQVTGSTFELRFCFQTSSTSGHRHGWYIDNLSLTNQGDLPGAWFHGNMNGNYANNAQGILYLHSDLSGYSGTLDVEIWANWDLEGSYADNLLTSVSVDNGSTWRLISGIPGLPGNGFNWQGTYYGDESLGWVPVLYSLPASLASHQNASTALFRFTLNTNQQTGYGGYGSSGWEGIAIDDITLHHRHGTAQAEQMTLANFSQQPDGTWGHVSGWKGPNSTYANEWNWTTEFGRNGPTNTSESFEQSLTSPAGWSIGGTGSQAWEIGQLGNTSGYGPGVFHSGDQGAALNLTTRYTNNIYTHLTTPEYTIPLNATSRLSFRSWICAEANWDGGGVSMSTDGGDSWWLLPAETQQFHDQISTVNVNSPFFNEGIIDGSNVQGGCGASNARPYALKTYDVSNLSGMTVRARFSFFSDTYVEADGWYIDDAGIEVDIFEPQGEWVSSMVSPDPMFGYGWVDGWYEQPEGTTLELDVLDSNLEPIIGHQNLSLPAYLAIDPNEHPNLHLRVRMSTSDTYVTPLIHSLSVGRTHYFDAEHLRDYSDVINVSTVDKKGHLVISGPFDIEVPSMNFCPHDGFRIVSYGDNLTWMTTNAQLFTSYNEVRPSMTLMNYSLLAKPELSRPLSIQAQGGEIFERGKISLDCFKPTDSPEVRLGWNNLSVFEWPVGSMSPTFGLNQNWADVDYNGTISSWDSDAPALLYTLVNESLRFNYTTLSKGQPSSQTKGPTFALLVSNASSPSELTVNGVTYPVEDGSRVIHHQSPQACPQATMRSTFFSNMTLYACTIEVELLGSGDVKVMNLQHLPTDQVIEVAMSASVLNQAKGASSGQDVRATLDIPLHVSTASGGVKVDLWAHSAPLMTETIATPSHTRWLPEESVTFVSNHQRLNPLDSTEDAPDISSIELWLSRSLSTDDAMIQLKVDRLDTTPRFVQMKGSGLAALNANASSVSCNLNTCTVTWSLTSTWLLDDVDDLHILAQATDAEGLVAGPTSFVSKTAFNEVENDMEVIGFKVTDELNRRLDDWSNPMWPFHLSSGQEMTAEGRVRIEGIPGQWVEAGQAEVTVTMRAVPPKNLSGGEDEWSSEPVNWSQHWAVDVDADGRFTVDITTPDTEEVMASDTWLELRPSISRRAEVGVNASTSDDRTVILSPVRLLYDTIQPTAGSLRILDSGREVPADNHIWMVGQDIPLRLQLSDPEGLAHPLEVWTWLEERDDVDQDGQMDDEEYRMETVSVNVGVTQAEVDLPLLSWSSVTSSTSEQGRASIVVRGQDLAGNPLEGGGEFGEETDLATILVQPRYDTLVDSELIQFDRVNETLLAGKNHSFSLTLSDANGLESLDELRLALLGRSNESSCYIHYEPRFAVTTYDEACFIGSPDIQIVKRDLATIYDITFVFRLDWNASWGFASDGGIPSFNVIDEGQDLGLGLFQLSSFEWQPKTDLEMRWIDVEDTMAPFGQTNGSAYWFHRNDIVRHSVGLYHNNTQYLVQDLPPNASLEWSLNDGERRSTGEVSLSATGLMEFDIMMNENVMYYDYGALEVKLLGNESYHANPISYQIVLDDIAPRLAISPEGLLYGNNILSGSVTPASNSLDEVEVTVIVNDDTHLPPGPIEMHFVFYRMGQPVAGTEGITSLDFTDHLSPYTVYSSKVDFGVEQSQLTQSDLLVVWFELVDRSGRELRGIGTEENSFTIPLVWVAFEPSFSDLSAAPYRPQVGDNVSVYARVINEGILSGEATVNLRDDEGTLLASDIVELESEEWVNFVWYVEAWKAGRLGLNVEIVNHTPSVPIPLADIKAKSEDSSAAEMTQLSLSILSLVIAAAILFVVRQQRLQREESYHLEKIRRIVHQRLPPPVPQDLLQSPEEQ